MTLSSLGVLQCRERNMEHGDRQDSSAYTVPIKHAPSQVSNALGGEGGGALVESSNKRGGSRAALSAVDWTCCSTTTAVCGIRKCIWMKGSIWANVSDESV
jgi:hypothetical protein